MKTNSSQNELSLQTLIDSIPTPIFYRNLQYQYVGCNKAYEDFMGRKREELIGKSSFDFYPQEVAKLFKEREQKFIESKDTKHLYEAAVADGNGKEHWFYVVKSKFFNTEGNLGGIIVNMFDISERRNLEGSLEEERLLLRSLIESLPSPVFYRDPEFKYMGCNKAFEEFVGTHKKDIIGKSAFDFFPQEVASQYLEMEKDFLNSEDHFQHYENTLKNAQGEDRDFAVVKAKFHYPDGSLRGVIVDMFDITDRKVLEDKLIQAKEKTEKLYKDLVYKNEQLMSGIEYAGRIQKGIFQEKGEVLKHFKEAFIFLEPKAVVSGDFYWFTQRDELLFLAAVDCTGHGVPAALMTVLGNNFLNEIVHAYDVWRPDLILSSLNQKIKNTFHREDPSNVISDGMELGLCVIDKEKRKVYFSGARRPLYYIADGKLEKILGSRQSIGDRRKSKHFELHERTLKEGDIIYLATDGFQDQLREGDHQKYMSKRFKELLLEIHTLPFKEQEARLESVFRAWRGNHIQTDDVLVIGVRPF